GGRGNGRGGGRVRPPERDPFSAANAGACRTETVSCPRPPSEPRPPRPPTTAAARHASLRAFWIRLWWRAAGGGRHAAAAPVGVRGARFGGGPAVRADGRVHGHQCAHPSRHGGDRRR